MTANTELSAMKATAINAQKRVKQAEKCLFDHFHGDVCFQIVIFCLKFKSLTLTVSMQEGFVSCFVSPLNKSVLFYNVFVKIDRNIGEVTKCYLRPV